MKVRRTRKAQEYLSEWDREPEVMPEPMQEKKSNVESTSLKRVEKTRRRKTRTAKSGHRKAPSKQEVSERPKHSRKKNPRQPKEKN